MMNRFAPTGHKVSISIQHHFKRASGRTSNVAEKMKHSDLYDSVVNMLGDLANKRSLSISVRGDLDDCCGAAIDLDGDPVGISITRDHQEETIWVSCKIRPRPRAHLREYYVGQLAGFIEGRQDPYPLRDFASDAHDLLRHQEKFLDPQFLNSEDLRMWVAAASRRQFGQ